jgi:hypothetical protein
MVFLAYLQQNRKEKLRSVLGVLKNALRTFKGTVEGGRTSQIFMQSSNFSFAQNLMKSNGFFQERETSEMVTINAFSSNTQLNQSTVIENRVINSLENMSKGSASIEAPLPPRPQPRVSISGPINQSQLEAVASKLIIKSSVRIVSAHLREVWMLLKAPSETSNQPKRALKTLYGKLSCIKQKTVTTVAVIDEEGKSMFGTKRWFLQSQLIRQPRIIQPGPQVPNHQWFSGR